MKNIILLIFSIILCLMSLLLLVASPVFGVLFLAMGIGFIVYSVKQIKKSSKDPDSAPAAVSSLVPAPSKSPKRTPRPDGIPSRPYEKTGTIKIAGVTFKCKNDKDVMRQDVLSEMSDGDVVLFEEYRYKKEPAFLIVDPSSGLDIGNLPASIAEQFPGREIEGYLTGLDSFWPDDSDGLIYTSKVKYFVLQEASDAEG